MNKTKYDLDFLEKAFAYISNYSLLDIDISNMYNFSSKEKTALKKLKEIYFKVKLFKDYDSVSLEHFSDEEVLSNANQFLINLFPKLETQILALDNIIDFGNYSIHDTGLMYRLSNKDVTFNEILIPTNGSNYTSSTIIHEKTHALAFKNIELAHLFENNIELLPILLGKMYLQSINDPYSIYLDRIIRLNDSRECFQHLEFAKFLKNNPDKSMLDDYVYNYFHLSCHNYLIGELYSDLLIKKYLSDKEKMTKKLNQVLEQKLSIPDFLDSYQISLLNKNLIPLVKEETSKCKRLSIIP